jgi:hypothetical protein
MNKRIDKLNNLMERAKAPYFFVDPVGLSDDENEKVWAKIHKNDNDKLQLVREYTENLKAGNIVDIEKLVSELKAIDNR